MSDVDVLPDGLYWDGTYRWIKDEGDWFPTHAPFGMPSRPQAEGLRKIVERYEEIDWSEFGDPVTLLLMQHLPVTKALEVAREIWEVV